MKSARMTSDIVPRMSRPTRAVSTAARVSAGRMMDLPDALRLPLERQPAQFDGEHVL